MPFLLSVTQEMRPKSVVEECVKKDQEQCDFSLAFTMIFKTLSFVIGEGIVHINTLSQMASMTLFI